MLILLIIIVTLRAFQVKSFTVLSIQSNIIGNSEVSASVFQLNAIFVQFDSFHIFDALTFILHQYHLLFCRFN